MGWPASAAIYMTGMCLQCHLRRRMNMKRKCSLLWKEEFQQFHQSWEPNVLCSLVTYMMLYTALAAGFLGILRVSLSSLYFRYCLAPALTLVLYLSCNTIVCRKEGRVLVGCIRCFHNYLDVHELEFLIVLVLILERLFVQVVRCCWS